MPKYKPYSEIDDDCKLRQKFYNKRVNAKKEGISFSLTLEDFHNLLLIAGIKSSELGVKGWHLARHRDKGGYRFNNCRFIYYLDNLKEKKVSAKSRIASSKNILAWNLKKSNGK